MLLGARILRPAALWNRRRRRDRGGARLAVIPALHWDEAPGIDRRASGCSPGGAPGAGVCARAAGGGSVRDGGFKVGGSGIAGRGTTGEIGARSPS